MTTDPPSRRDGVCEPVISVLVIEDDAAMRDEFAAMVRATPGLTLLGESAGLVAARALLAVQGPPDVLLIDLGLPDGDGCELIAELAARAPATSALVASVFDDEAHVIRALEAGAKGYLLKDTSQLEFARAIRLVHAGGSPLSPQIARHLLKRLAAAHATALRARPMHAAQAAEKLSAREAEILTLISQGHSVAEVAKAAHLSAHTVTTHVKKIYEKLAVNNRVQAVNRARATGQIE